MKSLKLNLLISTLLYFAPMVLNAKTIDVYDCKYSTPPIVLIQLKDGKESCNTRTCISEVQCKSNISEVKIRSVCPGSIGKDQKWHCPEADDCVFDESIKVLKGTVYNSSPSGKQESNQSSTISK